ncbi:MAG: hypothetical protein QNJ16_21375 [Rhodobacter sp.]|nr:hypothetical protein [Rhodobacter sp.]
MSSGISGILEGIMNRCRVIDEDGGREEKAQRITEDRKSREFKSTGVPKLIYGLIGGEGFSPSDIQRDVSRLLDSGALHTILLGVPGTGKSVAAAVELRERGGRWVNSVDWCATSDWDQCRAPYLRSGLLVVDDVGIEPDKASYKLGHLVFHRHAEARQTIYTTNLTRSQLIERYDERVISRWREGIGESSVVDFKKVLRPKRGA